MSSGSENESVNLNESSIESDSQLENESEENNTDESEEEDHQDINVSEDSSDDRDIEGDDESNDNPKETQVKSAEDVIRTKIINRLKDHIGKQLFVRFNARLPEDEAEFQKQAKALSPLIIKANKPRQKYARFCLVDFETQKDRDSAFVKLRAAINKKDPAFKGIVVSIPRTESEQFVESIIQKKIAARERKLAKERIKRKIKQTAKGNTKRFTSTVLVRNLPGNVSKAEIRGLFPKAVDIQMKSLKGNKSSIATITLPTSMDAREAVKQSLTLGGTHLKITFHGAKIKKFNANVDKNRIKPETKKRKVICT